MTAETSIVETARANLAKLPRLKKIEDAPAPAPETEADEETFVDFPVLSEKALYGAAGAVISRILPYTEADAASLLVHLLAGYGALVGRGAHFRVGQTEHFLKLFAVVVGRTGQRKGTAWSEIFPLLKRSDPTFERCIMGGLSTGEGLIYAVRDDQMKQSKNGDIELVERGIEDKRLLAIEEEFGGLLQRSRREGNTLSAVIRQSWDAGVLRVVTKQPVTATDSHIGIIGHITNEELVKTLNETETANGFANRFLWVCVRRSKFLPDGDSPPAESLNEIAEYLRRTLVYAQATGEMRRTSVASDYWHTIYEPLSTSAGGLLGTVTSRAPVQVLRLACLYALLEMRETVDYEHLEAAYHFWQFAYDSAKYIFGVTTGDRVAERIYKALAADSHGISRTELNKFFSGHLSKSELTRGLQSLIETGRAERVREATAGRPKEIFKVIGNQ